MFYDGSFVIPACTLKLQLNYMCISVLLVHFLGNCVLVRLVDQRGRKMEVTF